MIFPTTLLLKSCYMAALMSNSFRMGLFKAKKTPLHKTYQKYPTMMKFGTLVPYERRYKKYINYVTHLLSCVNISIFSPKISKFGYIITLVSYILIHNL